MKLTHRDLLPEHLLKELTARGYAKVLEEVRVKSLAGIIRKI